MKKKLLWLVPLTIIGSLLLVACGSDDEEVAAPAAPAPAPQGKSVPVAGGVATAVVPTAAPAAAAPTARPAPKQDKSAPGAAMYQDGSSIADILAGPAIGDIDSEKFNKDRFGGTLRWVPQGNVPNLDGMLSGTAVGRGVSWHFWESLAQWDGNGALKGDLADVWTIAEDSDGAHYSFTLRDGRSWHDGGQPTSEDVKASFARYLGKDGSFGPSINDRLKGGTVDTAFEIVNDDQFVIHLTEPTGLLLMALGYVGGTQPQIMPKATVDKYMTELAQEFNASGPYKFISWDQGNDVVLDRYDAYVPRAETPSYRAGAKLGYFARLHTIEIPDQETRVAALITGEVDSLDVISGDFYEEAMKHQDKIGIHVGNPGAQPDIGFNTGSPLTGFTEKGKLMRRAIRAAIDAEEVMKGYGEPSLWTLCPSLQHCGVAWEEASKNEELYNQNDAAKAKDLLQQAGYNGEEIIILDPTDFPTIHPQAPVLLEQLKDVGINAKIYATDWSGQIGMLSKAEGWHIFTNWNSSNLYHPLVATHYRTTDGTTNTETLGVAGYPYGVGYDTGDKMHQLRKDFANAKNRAEELVITKAMADLAWADPRRVHFGQFFQLRLHDINVRDSDVRGHPVGSPLYLNQWWGDASKRAEVPK